jgi:hypothetical protein
VQAAWVESEGMGLEITLVAKLRFEHVAGGVRP